MLSFFRHQKDSGSWSIYKGENFFNVSCILVKKVFFVINFLAKIYIWLFDNVLQKEGHANLACMCIILTGKNRQVTLDKWPIMRSMFNHARAARPLSAMHPDALKSWWYVL